MPDSVRSPGTEAEASFASVIEVDRVMTGFDRPWFVSGGWAIDLFLGHVTREHEDLEIGAFFPDQRAIRELLQEWDLFRIRDATWVPWVETDRIELPEFQAQARSARTALPAFDIFFNPIDGDDWLSRRHAGVRVAVADLIRRTPARIPYLAPEVQLLYKAKYHRAKDDADFEAAIRVMDAAQRQWLRKVLATHHPGDPWLGRL